MTVLRIDANELDSLANVTSGTRNDLWWALKPLEAGAWAVPFPYGTRREWDHMRSVMNGVMGALEGDERALRDRAGRVRRESNRSMDSGDVLRWLAGGTGAAATSLGKHISTNALNIAGDIASHIVERLPSEAAKHIALHGTSNGLWRIGGSSTARWLSGLHAAKTLRPATFFARFGRHTRMAKIGGVAITAAVSLIENYGEYRGNGWQTVAWGTVLDTALVAGGAAAIVAMVGFAPLSLPALAVGIGVSLTVSYLRETPQYREFVRNPSVGSAANLVTETGKDVHRGAVNLANGAVKSVSSAVSSVGNFFAKPQFAFA